MSDMTDLRRAIGAYDASYPPSILGEPDPRITALTPNTMGAAGGAATITVTGSGFTPTSVVEINQAAQTTTYVSATSLTVSYNPSVAGPVSFTVREGEGESNSFPFNVSALSEEPAATNGPARRRRRNGTDENGVAQEVYDPLTEPSPAPRPTPEPDEPTPAPEPPEPAPEPDA